MVRHLPAELQVGRFMESRSAELALLCGELERAGSGKLASQQVNTHSTHFSYVFIDVQRRRG